MSEKRMLIDQSYEMETRVAIVQGSSPETYSLENYNHEFSHTKPKKGNIYWAQVMQIVPSLQAAFVDFGEGKHGFLPFAEIHPDYHSKGISPSHPSEDIEEVMESSDAEGEGEEEMSSGRSTESSSEEGVASVKSAVRTRVRIRDVLKINQRVLVQVVKDARGTKGAALTTYISLPGKYSVLLPNTAGGTGVSKKITDSKERTYLKSIMESLCPPEGMSIIVRTAGLGQGKRDIKRDYEYLQRLWSQIFKAKSQSPAMVYEESDLVIRAVRDLYGATVESILIQGEQAYKKAQGFMRMFMPSHLKRVELYREELPLFQKFGLEAQIEKLYQETVVLPSGGEIVINSTEALVAIDVNSARSTRESKMEEMTLKTNLEAAIEIARQLRLRDLSGLIVIDFIDMTSRNNEKVEKALKDALKIDKARLQIGKISEFGLLEMSRQRLRTSLMESGSVICKSCHGRGRLLSPFVSTMRLLRKLEQQIGGQTGKTIYVETSPELASYMLNEKRPLLTHLEDIQGIQLVIQWNAHLSQEEFHIKEHQEEPLDPLAHPKKEPSREFSSRPLTPVLSKPSTPSGKGDPETPSKERPRKPTLPTRRPRPVVMVPQAEKPKTSTGVAEHPISEKKLEKPSVPTPTVSDGVTLRPRGRIIRRAASPAKVLSAPPKSTVELPKPLSPAPSVGTSSGPSIRGHAPTRGRIIRRTEPIPSNVLADSKNSGKGASLATAPSPQAEFTPKVEGDHTAGVEATKPKRRRYRALRVKISLDKKAPIESKESPKAQPSEKSKKSQTERPKLQEKPSEKPQEGLVSSRPHPKALPPRAGRIFRNPAHTSSAGPSPKTPPSKMMEPASGPKRFRRAPDTEPEKSSHSSEGDDAPQPRRWWKGWPSRSRFSTSSSRKNDADRGDKSR